MSPEEKAKMILAAAVTVLSREGYAATTISQVAAEAGVSRGLLHYYFKSKEELLAAVVRANVETSLELVANMFSSVASLEKLAEGLTKALRGMIQDAPEFFILFFESWALGRQSPLMASELQTLYRRFREAMAEGLSDLVEQGILPASLSVDGAATVLTALVDGLGLQLITEPELITEEPIWKTTERTIRTVLGGQG
ncbi:MAG: TetR family transcriptional regulator [bacterium]|nr:TetR family transcriptional regulator [bacterium]